MNLAYIYVFLQSNLLEVPVYYYFYRRQKSFRKTLLLITLTNLISHPLVYFGFMASPLNLLVAILAAETFAVLSEAIFHNYFVKSISFRRALAASLLANFVSWQFAPLLTYYALKVF